MSDTMALSVDQLSFQFGSRLVLDSVNVELPVGKILSVIGPNGSGKSTLLKTCAGFYPQPGSGYRRTGRVVVQGHLLDDLHGDERVQWVTYSSGQLRSDLPVTVMESMRIALPQSTSGEIQSALDRFHCGVWSNRPLQSLSGGELQWVLLVRRVMMPSRLLILDEALSQMDLNHQTLAGGALMELAKNEGRSFVIVAHDINLATEWADRVLLLKGGKVLAQGKPRDVLTRENLEACYPGAALEILSGDSPKVLLKKP